MLSKMKFVMGSVAKKDLVGALTHFRIENGRIQGFNGKLALSSEIDFDIDCTPKAATLIKAIDKCEETIQLGMTKAGKLSVKSGKFRTYITCIEGVTPHVQPEGDFIPVDGVALIKALKLLQPFVGSDASRPWAMGVLFKGQSAYATNNVVMAEYWVGSVFNKEVVIPKDAIKEMLRIKEPPIKFQMSESSLTVHYEDGRWLRTALIASGWPDMQSMLNSVQGNYQPIPEEFFKNLETLKPFTDKLGRVILENGVMRTHPEGHEEGGVIELDWIQNKSTFVLTMLACLEGVATHIDLTTYPSPCPWYGENVRGLIVGLRWLDGVNI